MARKALFGAADSRYACVSKARIPGDGAVRRLGIILYTILRYIALGTAGYGAYKGYFAPQFNMWVFMLFCAPAILILLLARLIRRVLAGY
jgi:hypothetical protein